MSTACTEHPGHRRFVGGPLDGHVDHLVSVTWSDYPLGFTYPSGARYERSLDGGTEVEYRFTGWVTK